MANTHRFIPWPYASAFSLIACFGRLQVLSASELRAAWNIPAKVYNPCSLVSLSKLPNLIGIDRLSTSLGLRPAEIKLAFDACTWWPAGLADVAHRLPQRLRACLSCLNLGYHTLLYQLPWWFDCPIHGRPLEEHCPACSHPLPDLTPQSLLRAPRDLLTCRSCLFDLVNLRELSTICRRGVPELMHKIFGAHCRWMRSVEAKVLVPFTSGSDAGQVSRELAIDLVGRSGVPLPDVLRPLARLESSSSSSILWRRSIDVETSVESNDELRRSLVELHDNGAGAPTGLRRFPLEPDLAGVICKIDARLSRNMRRVLPMRECISGGSELQGKGSLLDSGSAWAQGFLNRGYQRRLLFLKFSKVEDERHVAGALDLAYSELSEVPAARLVGFVERLVQATSISAKKWGAVLEIARWWYAHLTVNLLIDATVYSTHINSYVCDALEDRFLRSCWPKICLDESAPSKDWCLAAFQDCSNGYVRIVGVLSPLQMCRGRYRST